MRQCGLVMLMLCSAWAFADPDVPDPLMVPDASVGQGGAQQGNEESDTATVCTSDKDCDRGLKCDHNKCTWQQYRQATFSGCGGKALATLAVGLVLAGRRRRSHAILEAREEGARRCPCDRDVGRGVG